MKWLWRLGVILLGLFAVQLFLVSTFIVENTSMLPSYDDGDIVVVSKIAGIERGDVVVVDAKQAFFTTRNIDYVIKRVIAVGEDHVVCCNKQGKLLLNEQPLEEPYVLGSKGDIPFDVRLPQNTVWLMGDNRKNSLDSRDLLGLPGGGAISVNHIIGEVVWALWRN
ncbi:MAG: signal peptidase I [Candidatus Nanopelagicales bacterium]